MRKDQALKKVRAAFSRYKRLQKAEGQWLRNLKSGKLYELYCLSKVLKKLSRDYGYRLNFKGGSIMFKMNGGAINPTEPRFELIDAAGQIVFELHTDIEFRTLGASLSHTSGLCSLHELDIAIVVAGIHGHPRHDEIALGVECKSHAVFIKSIVKEVLGLRRELSLLDRPPSLSTLSLASSRGRYFVPANPPSEYWLVFASPRGLFYSGSPGAFGIMFKHWQP